MKPKAFLSLAAITAVALAFAIASYVAQNRLSQARISGAALFPGLAQQADRIVKVVVTQGDKSLTLARDKGSWTLADRADYPAKGEAVRALLIKLAQAELVEAKTRGKERYAMLELEDTGLKDAKSRLLQLLDDKGGVIAEVVLGKRRHDAFGSAKSGTYVRKPSEAQTWLVNADLDAPVGVRSWVQPSVIDIPAAKIASATIEVSGEEPLKIVRDPADTNKHSFAVTPEGKKLKDSFAAGAIVRAAGSIELEDVRKLAEPNGEVSLARLEGDGGLTLTLRLRRDGEDYWLSAEAAGTSDEAKKTAEEITRRVQGWEFKLPSSKAQAILKRRSDLFEAS